MDNKETYFNSKEFRKILQRYEQSIKMEQQEYFESEELTDIAEFSTMLYACIQVQQCLLFLEDVWL